MAGQCRVDGAPSPTYVGDVLPSHPACNSTWCDTSSIPYQLKVFDCRTQNWVFCGYYTTLGQVGTAGYVGGGYNTSSIKKMLFSTEATAVLASNTGTNTSHTGGFHGGSGGYFVANPTVTNVIRLAFSTDAAASITSTWTGYDGATAALESSNAGYWESNSSEITKMLLSTEAVSVASMSGPGNADGTSFSSSSTGYWAFGGTTSKLTFLTDTVGTYSAMVIGVTANRGGIEGDTNGYSHGGINPGNGSSYNVIQRLTFSSETWATLSSGITNGNADMASFVSRPNGYMIDGGYGYTYIDKLSFATETRTQAAGTMSAYASGGFENLN